MSSLTILHTRGKKSLLWCWFTVKWLMFIIPFDYGTNFLFSKPSTYWCAFLSVGPDHQCLDVLQPFHWLWHHIHDQLQLLKTANTQWQSVLKKKKNWIWFLLRITCYFKQYYMSSIKHKVQVNETELYYTSCLLTLLYTQQLNKLL